MGMDGMVARETINIAVTIHDVFYRKDTIDSRVERAVTP
jgi:hypothetical protein